MLPVTLSLYSGLAMQLASMVNAAALGSPNSHSLVSRAPPTFQHPGVLLDSNKLSFIRDKVNAQAAPWTEAFDAMLKDELASPTRQPNPRPTVECGANSNPDNGCTEEREDALAAYTNALAWVVTSDKSYAQKAIGYMEAWASVIKNHTGHNAPLQSGWSAAAWGRAAEIIRYTDTDWPQSNITEIERMLRDVYLPVVNASINANGNWDLSMLPDISLMNDIYITHDLQITQS